MNIWYVLNTLSDHRLQSPSCHHCIFFQLHRKHAFHCANLLLISCPAFIKVTLDYSGCNAYGWSILNIISSVLVLEAMKRWAQIVCEWQNREFSSGMLAALGVYWMMEQCTPSARLEIRQICSEELLYEMALLPFGGTSVHWNLMRVQRKCRALCLRGTTPGTSTHCSRGQQLDGKQLGREASRILLNKKPVVCSCGQGRQQHPGLHLRSIASRLKEVILSFHSALERYPQISEFTSGLPREFRDILKQI